jgi:YVTN family beta-propeller protein
VQQRPEPPVTGQIMRGVYCLVILAEELSAFMFGQFPQDDLRIVRFLGIYRLGRHNLSLRPGYRTRGRPADATRAGLPPSDQATAARFTRATQPYSSKRSPTPPKTTGPLIKVGHNPVAMTITPDGGTIYVANSHSGTVTPISTATNKPGRPIKVGSGPDFVAVTPDGREAYVLSVTRGQQPGFNVGTAISNSTHKIITVITGSGGIMGIDP